MGKVFFFLFLVVAIWTGIEVMNHGMGGAFGGALARTGLASPEQGAQSTPMGRAASRFEDAYQRAEERVDRQAP